jgi:hypothetical protein
MPSSRITLHHLRPHTSRVPIPQYDARIAGAGIPPPSVVILDFMYGVAAYHHWGSGQDFEEVLQHRFTEHYKSIPIPATSQPSSDDDSSPESDNLDDKDEYKPSRPSRGGNHSSNMPDGMLQAMDNVLTLHVGQGNNS